eukprot:435578_1
MLSHLSVPIKPEDHEIDTEDDNTNKNPWETVIQSNVEIIPQWIHCILCRKWRTINVSAKNICNWKKPPNWNCSYLKPPNNNCNFPQQMPDQTMYSPLQIRALSIQRQILIKQHQHIETSNIYQLKKYILKYDIFDERVNCIENVSGRDPATILLATNCFSWLYNKIISSHTIIKFKTAQKYICDNIFASDSDWNLLLFACILFVKCFNYPSTMRKIMQNMKLFKRFMIIFIGYLNIGSR